ncbi:cytochrome P450 [Echria macrotheca]|uniref:Cytochrome P450 n=1 Tax=Echria macrotheca TaxID=438768 RepID=A0AAJ0BMU4_9PEZI|nr:cytochrome P450 [Echria macrotheca]
MAVDNLTRGILNPTHILLPLVYPLGLTIILTLLRAIYNIYLHPLRSYPGPRLWAATEIPYTLAFTSGKSNHTILALHKKYGPVVRVGPSRLSFTHADAWRDIRGHRRAGEGENPKEESFYSMSRRNIIGAPRDDHTRFRRVLAHGFSASVMQKQEPLITRYIDQLMDQLNARSGEAVDMVEWMNFTTFDVIGDLAFGEPFGSLADGTMHPWIGQIFQSVAQFARIVSARRYFPSLVMFIARYAPKLLMSGFALQIEYSTRQVDKRLGLATSRPDFIDSMSQGGGQGGEKKGVELSHDEIVHNARMIVLAGSETTATALSNFIFLMCKYPDVQKRLAAEVREAFADEKDITFQAVMGLRYSLAVLDESMRLLPTVPAAFPRVAATGGITVGGNYVPEGTVLDIFPLAMFRDARNFVDPDEFVPERWLDDERDARYEADNHAAFQPFSFGPRNCIGKNLAYVEMRVIIARLIWKFGLEFADKSQESWFDNCLGYNLWNKPPLMVKLTPRENSTAS